MIEHYLAAGDTNFAISSSGNAALAAALYVQEKNRSRGTDAPITLDIFVGNHVSPRKLQKIQAIADANAKTIRILIKERPLQALTQATQDGARSLRQSTDDVALLGYESLAEELAADATSKKIAAVFIGTSSGTTAQALAAYFLKKKLPIQVHIVQTSSCHPLSAAFESYDGPDEPSIAEAIVDITGYRKDALIPLIEKTGGSGWIATNEDIKSAQELVSKHAGLEISTNSALSVFGAMEAVYTSHPIDGAVVCMICGE
jgi:threonine dehydratase